MVKPWRIKRNLYLLTLVIALFFLSWVNVPAANAEESVDRPDATKAMSDESRPGFKEKVAAIRLPFIFNQGQIIDESVKFYANTFGGTVYVSDKGDLVYSLPKFEVKANDKAAKRLLKHKLRDELPQPKITKGWSLKEQLVGAFKISPRGIDQAQTKVNYFIGNDKSKWCSNLLTYNMISFDEVYPGIDFSLNAHGNKVEKTFTVNPGADVDKIKLKLKGFNSITVNDKGELEIATGLGTVCFTKPVAYQEKDGKREYVQVSYRLDGETYGFTVGDYDKSIPLIIDPLLASTFNSGEIINDFGGYCYEGDNST